MTTIKTWRERLEPLTTRTRAVNKAEVAMQAEIDELRIALERKDQLLKQALSALNRDRIILSRKLREQAIVMRLDVIEAITKELT